LKKDGCGTGAAYTDINGDGVLDALISHGECSEQPLTVYSAKKDKTRSNNWLRVKILTRYGAAARGALVTLTTNVGIRLTQVIDEGSGYLCQMEPVTHFGLGQYAARSSLMVVLTVTFIFSPFLSADHELNDDVVSGCFMTISWFASFSESNTSVNFSPSVHVAIIDRAAYCPSPKWVTGSI
jgi:hypothetical protein